ncbi:MAG: PD-(D/E)XK nuclease family protein [Pyrinomonadaceae bacterium]
MQRTLITDPIPARPVELSNDRIVITPSPAAAASLGVQCLRLESYAGRALRRAGVGIATSIQAAEALRLALKGAGAGGPHAAGALRAVRAALGDILRAGVDVDRLQSAAESPRIAEIAAIAKRYVEILAGRGLIDGEARLAVASRLERFEPAKLLVYGYFRGRDRRARPEEFEFIDRAAGDGSIFYLPVGDGPMFEANREWAEWFVERGWSTERTDPAVVAAANAPQEAAAFFAAGAASDSEPPSYYSGEIRAVDLPDLEAEVRYALATIKREIVAGTPPSSIAVACRDQQRYAATFIAAAREFGLPVEIDHRVPLAETAFGELVSLIFEVVDRRGDDDEAERRTRDHLRGFLYEPTLRMLCHRFGPGLGERPRAQAMSTLPSTLERWAAITDALAPLADTSGERRFLEWVNWLRQLMRVWDVRTKTAYESCEIQSFNVFFESLDELARERGDGEGCTITQFASDVAEILSDVKIDCWTAKGGVRVMQPNSLVGADLDLLFVVGMAEGITPEATSDSGIIDFCDRRRLAEQGVHFETPLEVPRWEAQTFYYMLLGARRVVLSFPRFDGGEERIASSYFRRLGLTPRRPAERLVSSDEEYRRFFLRRNDAAGLNGADAVLDDAARRCAIEMRRQSAEPCDEYDGVIGVRVERRSWSATSLTRLGTCGFKWFGSDVLRLGTTEEADAADLRADIRGRLFHRTLELAVNRSLAAADLRTATLAVLDEAFSEAEAEYPATALVENWELRRGEVIELLRAAIESDDFIKPGARVEATERAFERVEYGGVQISGTIDRIDRLPDGTLEPIDYKSGTYVAKIKDDEGLLKVDLQLPIYSRVALPAMFPGELVGEASFFSIKDAKRVRGKDVDLAAHIAKLCAMADTGSFPVEPDVKRDSCRYCDLLIVCRAEPSRLERKAAARAAE